MQPRTAFATSTGLLDAARRNLSTVVPDPDGYAAAVLAADDDPAVRGPQAFTDRVTAGLPEASRAVLEAISEMAGATPGGDLIDLARWDRTRIVYTVDETFADALADTGDDATIPADALRRLPHPNPMVMLPAPVRFARDGGGVEKYVAALVVGVRPTRRRCSTSDADATAYMLVFLGYACDDDGDTVRHIRVPDVYSHTLRRVPHQVGMRVLVNIADATLAEHRRAAVADMRAAGDWATEGFVSAQAADAACEQLCALGVSLLTYLSSDRADVRPAAPVASRKLRRRGAGPAPTVFEVGYRVGASLRAAGYRPPGPPAGTGRTVAAHIRRAHLHTFRVGKGRTGRVVRWIPPVAVGWDDGSPPAATTIVRF